MQDEGVLSAEFQERIGVIMDAVLTPEEKASAVGAVAADVERRLAKVEAGERALLGDKALPAGVGGRRPLGILSRLGKPKPAAPKPAPKPAPEVVAEPSGAKPYVDDLLRGGAVGSKALGDLPSSN